MKYHPDKNSGDKEAEQKFQQLKEAKEILCDPERRQLYDKWKNSGLKISYKNWIHSRTRRLGSMMGDWDAILLPPFSLSYFCLLSMASWFSAGDVEWSFKALFKGVVNNYEFKSFARRLYLGISTCNMGTDLAAIYYELQLKEFIERLSHLNLLITFTSNMNNKCTYKIWDIRRLLV